MLIIILAGLASCRRRPLSSNYKGFPISSSMLKPWSIPQQWTKALEVHFFGQIQTTCLLRWIVDVVMQTVRTALLLMVTGAASLQPTLMKDARRGLHSLVCLGRSPAVKS